MVGEWGLTVSPRLAQLYTVINGEMSVTDILACLAKGTMQLFIVQKGQKVLFVMLTEFVQYSQKFVLRVIGVAGEKMILTRRFIPAFEQWAKDCGASEIETYATADTVFWNKALGYNEQAVMMCKRL
jgi:hypothetical protein